MYTLSFLILGILYNALVGEQCQKTEKCNFEVPLNSINEHKNTNNDRITENLDKAMSLKNDNVVVSKFNFILSYICIIFIVNSCKLRVLYFRYVRWCL